VVRLAVISFSPSRSDHSPRCGGFPQWSTPARVQPVNCSLLEAGDEPDALISGVVAGQPQGEGRVSRAGRSAGPPFRHRRLRQITFRYLKETMT
jgi:hypothetical protein